ncbi:pilus assembly protein TadG-related protein [Nocardioides rubriscoriae]|uniref:pilus assembly protein TadG-related protein n=1 Tax=Nocardioides rubriscoriae TaxID=642762 RepID=UPI0011DF356F|nr:pilus assembly protein TadG-related protein [Nocardioides rubriscoriae]
MARRREGSRRDERGSVTPLIIGFAAILLLTIAVVVDASTAFLRRQGLATLAEGAALQGADLGAEGTEVYDGGLGDQPLRLTESVARAAVADYLRDVGAYRDHPGLTFSVAVDGARIEVSITAAADFPLAVPGVASGARVTGTGSAVADPE